MYVTLDFGSANSGAIINPKGQDYNHNELIFLHETTNNKKCPKQQTIFWVKKDLLEMPNITSDLINVYSCVFYEDKFVENANFIWCREQIEGKLVQIGNDESWVEIRHPKMSIYKNPNVDFDTLKIQDNRGNTYALGKVIKLFLMVIRKEAIYRVNKYDGNVNPDEIQWGMTVPGLAIWHQNSTQALKNIAQEVFGSNFSMFTEPHSALIGVNISNSENKKNLNFENGRYSLIVDLGGGTADICVMKESILEDGTHVFDEEKLTKDSHDATLSEKAGGNDIDKRFKVYFVDKLSEGEDKSLGLPINWLWNAFARENPGVVYKFEEQWHDLQFSKKINEEKVYFNPGREYKQWLKIKHPQIVDKFDEYGELELDCDELRKEVFSETYSKILNSVEEVLTIAKQKGIELDLVYFAGGLSLDTNLKDRIKSLIRQYAPYANTNEVGGNSAIGAIQIGGNHLAVNKGKLLRQMARKTFYVIFAKKFDGDKKKFKDELISMIKYQYNEHGISYDSQEIENAYSKQEHLMKIDDTDGTISYLYPIFIKFEAVSKPQKKIVNPVNPGQTRLRIYIFSSNDNLLLFPTESDILKKVYEIDYDFGYEWKEAELIFDPFASNAVEGSVKFILKDQNGKEVKECIIENITQRGL